MAFLTGASSVLLAVQVAVPDSGEYSGARGATRVPPPRIEESVTIDGRLEEAVWTRAARLTGFTQYSPADGRPAESPTEALVWYSPTAIHFGIRAAADPGTVRAHLTDRDKGIQTDDYIEIQLGTFNDGRQVFVFATNPLGIQADGTLVEGNQQRRGFLTEAEQVGREQADLSPDFVFDSKGRLTEEGYEIELRIPFKSVRYRTAESQDWSLQIIRRTAYAGREDTWFPARRDASSFIAQAGTLVGLTDLRRGLVLELNPIVTSTVDGGPVGQGWSYGGGRPDPGGNVRFGLSTNLTLNGTINPDFSQIESDAGQVSPDPRRALFFAEKRPFFLDGLEFFSTPSQVIYTRRIAAPLAATKITGKVAGTSFGFLSAVDGEEFSPSGEHHPVFNLLRVQRDVGDQSRLGFAYTDRIDGPDYNRVGQVDGRIVFGGINNLSFYGAVSRTRSGDAVATAPMWSATFNRTGRVFGLQATTQAVSDRFLAGSGFLAQADWVTMGVTPSITFYGGRDALIQRFMGSVFGNLEWTYTGFTGGGPALNRRVMPRVALALRGGWTLGAIVFFEFFGYDQRLYQDYAIERTRAGVVDTIPFTGGGRFSSLSGNLTIKSPEIHGFSVDGFVAHGQEIDWFEWAKGSVWFSQLNFGYRPTQKLRLNASFPLLIYHRHSDGTFVGSDLIPRLKVEYQLSRAIFLRMVGEYRSVRRDSLRDHGRTGFPILLRDESGVYRRDLALAFERNDFRADFLFSYQPTPGTVIFAGYGSSLTEDRAFRFRGLERTRDSFFTKLSYLFRL